MQLEINIPFQQLLDLIKSLPKSQQQILRVELEKVAVNSSTTTLEELLLSGPVAQKEDLDRIRTNRKSFNQWRSK
jgi:Tfp pilus assembly PilM family ATPase